MWIDWFILFILYNIGTGYWIYIRLIWKLPICLYINLNFEKCMGAFKMWMCGLKNFWIMYLSENLETSKILGKYINFTMIYVLNSKLSDECIDFTMMYV